MAKIWRWSVHGNDQLGDLWVMGLHYQTDVGVGGSEPSAATMADKIDAHFSSSGHNLSKVVAVMNGNVSLTGSSVYERVTPGSSTPPEVATRAYSLGGTASAPTDSLPPAVCAWLKCTTAKAGRSFRGGTHSPPSPNAADLNNSGSWDSGSTYWTNLIALGTAIVDVINDIDVAGTDLVPVIYSHRRHQLGLDPTEQIVTCAPVSDVRWLRRRMVRHGA